MFSHKSLDYVGCPKAVRRWMKTKTFCDLFEWSSLSIFCALLTKSPSRRWSSKSPASKSRKIRLQTSESVKTFSKENISNKLFQNIFFIDLRAWRFDKNNKLREIHHRFAVCLRVSHYLKGKWQAEMFNCFTLIEVEFQRWISSNAFSYKSVHTWTPENELEILVFVKTARIIKIFLLSGYF